VEDYVKVILPQRPESSSGANVDKRAQIADAIIGLHRMYCDGHCPLENFEKARLVLMKWIRE